MAKKEMSSSWSLRESSGRGATSVLTMKSAWWPCLWEPQLDSGLESPHHNQTIRSSAKIADMRQLARRAHRQHRQQSAPIELMAHECSSGKQERRLAAIMISNRLQQQANSAQTAETKTTTSFQQNDMVQEHRFETTSNNRRPHHQSHSHPYRYSASSLHSCRRRKSLMMPAPCTMMLLAATLLVTLLLATIPSGAFASDSNNGAPSAPSQIALTASAPATVAGAPAATAAKAEALISAAPSGPKSNNGGPGVASDNQNVILIKYANVTSGSSRAKDDGDEQQAATRLNVYQLYNEPLSVSVIESKFSHSIQLFDVSHNQLSTLPKDLFCPLSNEVRQLNISHNSLENFDSLGLISQAGQLCLSELRVLDMSHNLIKHLPATGVATLLNLEVLNLSHNLIESLDELSLSALFKLTRLDLSHNRIQQLPARIFHKSASMQVLRLQANHLQNAINQVFLAGLIALEELNLSRNNISHVHELAFLDKPNLTRVDLSHNQLNGLRQEALRVTVLGTAGGANSQRAPASQSSQPPIYKPRLHHNGQYAGLAQVNAPSTRPSSNNAVITAEFLLSANPFICDCQLDWMRKFQARRSTRFPSHRGASSIDSNDQLYLSDQPASVISQQQQSASSDSTSATSSANSENSNQQQQQSSSTASLSSSSSSAASSSGHYYGRVIDLELVKCSPLFRRNAQLRAASGRSQFQSRSSQAPSDGSHANLAVQVHHANNHLHHNHHHNHHQSHGTGSQQLVKSSSGSDSLASNNNNNQHQMIDLLTADSSNFLCRYRSHCFALCHCCEFDACDCEMICPAGCNCYYDSSWQTNIIDCSANNHTVVPDRIPMDVSGLYLDGNNIDSLKPSNLIARKSLKTLYLNASNLQFIANRTFNGLIELQTLYLNDNMLRTLHGYEFEPLAQLRALYLQSNRLDQINNQTFIYLRSLEVLDLSNNRLTSLNLNLFMSIGHHNIRLRQLSIAHNWWSCQCNMITSFRQILKQKFLLNGGVNIVDRNQLRCYYNSTTVGPLILDSGAQASSSSSLVGQQQPVFGSFLPASGYPVQQQAFNRQQQQQQLTEINQCSELVDEQPFGLEFNPPIIQAPFVPEMPPPPPPPASNMPSDSPVDDQEQAINQLRQQQQQQTQLSNPYQNPADPSYYPPGSIPFEPTANEPISYNQRNPINAPTIPQAGVPLTSFIFVTVLLVCILVVAISVFIFVRQQQRYHNHLNHHHHHKKSSAASTISVSSSASSTAISTHHHHHHNQHGGVKQFDQRAGEHHHHQTLHFGQQQTLHQNHLIMGHNAATLGQHHLVHSQQQPEAQHHHHHHSASSQSNIYAALVSPTTGSSTIVTTNTPTAASIQQQQQQNSNLYSNSSSTASHHSSASSSQQHINGHQRGPGVGYPTPSHNAANAPTNRWHQQQQQQQHLLYGGAPLQQQQLYNQMPSNSPYALNASAASYKTGASLYNGPLASNSPLPASGGNNCQSTADGLASSTHADWIGLPKVRQFVSRLVHKSLALGGYRPANARDELAAVASDKIYDAFLSYDKRDEPFVLQHLSAELEYGLQYRVADRYRDLPLPTSAFMGEAITSMIGCSHRTIVVLSEHFLKSDWCRFELQAALCESALDKSHKIIAVVLEPKCLLDMDPEMRALLLTNQQAQLTQIYAHQQAQQQQQQQQQLVQLADSGVTGSGNATAAAAGLNGQDSFNGQQLVSTLAQGGQVCTQTAGQAQGKIAFVNYNERKFWPKLKQMMPLARPVAQTLTLTTKN